METPARRRRAARKVLAAVTASVLMVTGCTTPAKHEIPTSTPFRSEAVNFLKEEPVIVLKSQPNEFWTVDYDRGEPLPDIDVGPIRAREVPVSRLFDIIAVDANLGLVKDPGIDDVVVSYSDPRPRPLEKVLNALTAQTGLFYHYEDGILSFSSSRRFFVKVPRVAVASGDAIEMPTAVSSNSSDSGNSGESRSSASVTPPDFSESLGLMSKAIGDFGGRDIVEDKISGTVVFTGDQAVYRAVQKFIKSFEMGRDMIVYDIWILERQLSRDQQLGIEIMNSSMFDGNLGATIGGLQTGILANPASTTFEAILKMVDTNGNTSTVSRPTLPVISGSYASFTVGEEQQYITEISAVSSTENSSVRNSTETGTIRTGLNLVIGGAYADGIVNTQLSMTINSLIKFEEFNTGGTDAPSLRLPHTATRALNSSLDARPGDLIVIGGLIQGNVDRSNEDLVGAVPLSRSESSQKSELIMFMRPRLVKIRPAGHDTERLVGTVDVPVSSKSAPASPDERLRRQPVESEGYLGANVPGLVSAPEIPAKPEGYDAPPVPAAGIPDDEQAGVAGPAASPSTPRSLSVEPRPWWQSNDTSPAIGEE